MVLRRPRRSRRVPFLPSASAAAHRRRCRRRRPIPPPPEAAADPVSPLDSVSDGADKGSSAAAAAAAAAAPLVRKAAWKRPADGSIEVGPVMGAVLWPALSESTKAASKPSPSASSSSSSSSSDFLKGSDGSASASPGPMIAASSPKANLNNPNPKSNPNHAASQREKSMKHGMLANGWPSQRSSSTQTSSQALILLQKTNLT
uniref:Uncharacterized protein n=1 Tax=Ananas comosus var. bracteatus TaxID=296719 RepID=A0A6V7PY66_ANACO|nr:unnamed protein product [Ananas comosus var. bracteatus]